MNDGDGAARKEEKRKRPEKICLCNDEGHEDSKVGRRHRVRWR